MNVHPAREPLSETERIQAFREELRLTPETGGGRIVGRISKRVMWGGIAALAILGLGGQAVEHYFGNLGLPASSLPTTTFATPTTFSVRPTTTTPDTAAADEAFIHLQPIGLASASPFTLTDQNSRPYGIAQAKGAVTLVTFFNKNCNDICHVEGPELRQFLRDLGARGSHVNIIIVNTDPFSHSYSEAPIALSANGLARMPNVHFLTSTVANLNAVWKAYNIQVDVGAVASEVSHNSLIYFVTPGSQLSAIATPFAHENKIGQFSLGAADENRFAQGLVLAATSLGQ